MILTERSNTEEKYKKALMDPIFVDGEQDVPTARLHCNFLEPWNGSIPSGREVIDPRTPQSLHLAPSTPTPWTTSPSTYLLCKSFQ
jgi:hypothetical protein